ncbi:zonular occludens toxin domain-containing protein [Nanoarchaeota archaeon]
MPRKKKKSLLWRATKATARGIGKGAVGIGKGIAATYRFSKKKINESKEKKKIESSPVYKAQSKYVKPGVHKVITGNPEDLEERFNKDSIIALIFGKRGSGKSALGFKIMENINFKSKRSSCVLGINENIPKWVKPITDVEQAPSGAIVLVDEGAIAFGSRESMSSKNRELSKLLAIARHKNLTILFITQNTGLIDKNVLKLVDTLLVKEGSLLQMEMERSEIKKFYEKAHNNLKGLPGTIKQYVYIIDSDFEGVLSFPLPSFWSESLSKNQS